MLYTNEQIKSVINNIVVNNGLDNMEVNGKPMGILDDNIDIERYGSRILSQPPIRNPFMTALYQQFIYRATAAKYFTSPFDYFREKRDGVAFGTYEADVQPIFPKKYDMRAFDRILDFWETNSIVQYFAITRQDTFPQTITKTQLRQAFQSYEAFDDFLAKLILAPRNGNIIIETNAIKMLINQNFANGVIKMRAFPTNLDTEYKWQELAAEIVGIANGMTAEPTTLYNNFENIEGSNGVKAWTQSDRRDLVLIGDAVTIARIKTHVQAMAFNRDEVDFDFHFIVLNDWNYKVYDHDTREFTENVDSPIKLLLCDGGFIKLEDNLDEEYSDPNVMTMGLQRALQVQQTLGLRVNRNAVVWYDATDTITNIQYTLEKNVVNIASAGTEAVKVISDMPDIMELASATEFVSGYALTSGEDTEDAVKLTKAQAESVVTCTAQTGSSATGYNITRTSLDASSGETAFASAGDTLVINYNVVMVDDNKKQYKELVTIITPAKPVV